MGLLGRARARAEFERFVARESGGLLRTAFLATWDAGEAEELVQECLLRVARRWGRVRGMVHADAYARRVLANLVLDGSARRALRLRELGDRDGGVVGAGVVIGSVAFEEAGFAAVGEREALFGALGALSRRQRLVLALRYFADLSEADTAAALGCSVGTVKSTASRALAQLRESSAVEASVRTRGENQ